MRHQGEYSSSLQLTQGRGPTSRRPRIRKQGVKRQLAIDTGIEASAVAELLLSIKAIPWDYADDTAARTVNLPAGPSPSDLADDLGTR